MNKLLNFSIVIFFALFVSSCGGGQYHNDEPSDVGVIDYRSAFIFESNSTINKLLIRVNSRLTIGDKSNGKSYLLLQEHPRESTFNPAESPYSEMVDVAKGASFITFIYGDGVDSVVVSRRYARIDNENEKYLHECRAGSTFQKNFKNLSSSQVEEIKDNNIFTSAAIGGSYYGVFEYSAENSNAKIDFPVALINFNPNQNPALMLNNMLYQVVSEQVPILIPGRNTECDSIVPGYLAFRAFDGKAQAIYICNYEVNGI
ncbi:MAG: hypothetical protein ACOVNZ_08350, partial [Crocinitomicaceae bacterium]